MTTIYKTKGKSKDYPSEKSKKTKRVIESDDDSQDDDNDNYLVEPSCKKHSHKKEPTTTKQHGNYNIIFNVEVDDGRDYDDDMDDYYDSTFEYEESEDENEDESVSEVDTSDSDDESEMSDESINEEEGRQKDKGNDKKLSKHKENKKEKEPIKNIKDKKSSKPDILQKKQNVKEKDKHQDQQLIQDINAIKETNALKIEEKTTGNISEKELGELGKKQDDIIESSSINNDGDDEILSKLKELYEKNSDNKSIQKCLEVYETELKNKNKKRDKKIQKQKDKNERIFRHNIRDKNTTNDYTFFNKLNVEQQKKIIKEVRQINSYTNIEKPYRISLLETNIPVVFKASAMKKINSLRYMEPGSNEYYKLNNWVDFFMRIPFNKYLSLPVSITDGTDKCHDFMEKSQKLLSDAVYGLNDAKMQIMQMIGQLITNPDAVGCAIAIHGPPGTGKTSLVKEGISKILNRPFAFIALGGATDSSFLEGHSYTYEGSTWGKIVQILIDSKCMNPVIYFDELDKISDTPKGEEIVGILTHLTDTSQNTQFHDRYFSDIDFDLSKCIFIFSYNDETKINPILRDRMYRIQTKGYDKKQKTIIGNQYLLPKIREQVKFKQEDIIIPDETIHYIIENHCGKEDGVRTLKRCLEIIYTKLNLYRLMKPGTNLFEEDMSICVEFPFHVSLQMVDKLIKKEKDNMSLYSMYV